jgi:hypothetical protein
MFPAEHFEGIKEISLVVSVLMCPGIGDFGCVMCWKIGGFSG